MHSMSYLVRRAFRYAARRIAADPRTRQKAGEYAKMVSGEIRTIYGEEDRAYAAGRSVRRLMSRLQAGDHSRPPDTPAGGEK